MSKENPDELRKQLRRQCIAAREALPAVEHAALSARIAQHVSDELAQRPPGMLAFCWPFRAEFDARSLVTRLLDQGWRACLPVVDDRAADPRPMRFRTWAPQTPMAPDRHGIATPQAGDFVRPDVLLLPFNAIDAQGYRLGYGAGYFDRTLATFDPKPYTLGIGFSLGVVSSVVPQAHDIPVDCIVTETGISHI
ncbi:MAG TPA: 5-formyltetrahydrofolate cyclo-ligase [Rhodocyclaceae bacterium]|jgi:5,10-methenyltetrahydrofolate synthetase|nr:5-formyltetrahydrofolate cyclo-ligase [Rhodocyclaceae bacterium]